MTEGFGGKKKGSAKIEKVVINMSPEQKKRFKKYCKSKSINMTKFFNKIIDKIIGFYPSDFMIIKKPKYANRFKFVMWSVPKGILGDKRKLEEWMLPRMRGLINELSGLENKRGLSGQTTQEEVCKTQEHDLNDDMLGE